MNSLRKKYINNVVGELFEVVDVLALDSNNEPTTEISIERDGDGNFLIDPSTDNYFVIYDIRDQIIKDAYNQMLKVLQPLLIEESNWEKLKTEQYLIKTMIDYTVKTLNNSPVSTTAFTGFEHIIEVGDLRISRIFADSFEKMASSGGGN